MCLSISLFFLFSLCRGLSMEVVSDKLLVSQLEAMAAYTLAAEGAQPSSEWPIWRSPQKGIAKRKPDAQPGLPLAPWVVLHFTDAHQHRFFVAQFLPAPRTVPLYQSCQVYRL